MKNNTLQKLLATALVGGMAVSMLAGCGQTATESSAPAASTDAATTTTDAAPAADADVVAGIDGWTAFDSTVTLKIPV